MAKARIYLKATEVETEMQEARNAVDFVGKNETMLNNNMIKNAKNNSRIGDKLLMVVDPMCVHIPSWQRKVRVEKAYNIGNHYNKYKWEEPKVMVDNGQLICVDGQHRIYGAWKGGIDAVVVEVMECTMEEAIEIFLGQTEDRSKMRPEDIYKAAITAGKPEYLAFRDICHKHNVSVKGDDMLTNAVGTFKSITDGVEMAERMPETLDAILDLLGKLEWNGYADTYNGKAYNSTIVRALKAMYSYHVGEEKEMEDILIAKCHGTEFFVQTIMGRTKAQVFDYLSATVKNEMNKTTPFVQMPRAKVAVLGSTKAN